MKISSSLKSLVIIGASGVGKGTIIKNLKQRHPGLFQLVLSYTTRPIRPKEKHGVDYYFVSPEEFDKKKNNMVQFKFVHRNWYGTSEQHLQELLSLNKIPILDVDIEGMLEIKLKINCDVLCIMPPSWQLLRQRLKGRKTEEKQVIDKRMQQNMEQVQRMMSIKGTPGIYYVTNYQYQLTTYGVELWLGRNFQKFRQHKLQSQININN